MQRYLVRRRTYGTELKRSEWMLPSVCKCVPWFDWTLIWPVSIKPQLSNHGCKMKTLLLGDLIFFFSPLYIPFLILRRITLYIVHVRSHRIKIVVSSFYFTVVAKKGHFSFQYRFRAKNRDWVWLRTTAFAFLNPYTEEIEYVVCTNSLAPK